MSIENNIPETNVPNNDEVFGMKPNTLCMLIHLSQVLNYCSPPLGFVVPIVLWAVGKDKSVLVDQHGKVVLNWLISVFIYGLVIFSLCFALMGLLLIPLLLVVPIIFAVIGALKANEGIVWKYPLSIPFFK